MNYVTIKICKEELFQIAIEFDVSQDTPHYTTNKEGMEKLEGILNRVKNSWYPERFSKAAYLFVAICKNHLFFNGNKRLALVITLHFLYQNGLNKHKPITKKAYINWFNKEFANYKLSNKKFRTMYGWAFYNLNKAVASDTENSFDYLKQKVEEFFRLYMKY